MLEYEYELTRRKSAPAVTWKVRPTKPKAPRRSFPLMTTPIQSLLPLGLLHLCFYFFTKRKDRGIMVFLAPVPFNLASSNTRAAQSRREIAALCELQSRYMGARSSRICESNSLYFG